MRLDENENAAQNGNYLIEAFIPVVAVESDAKEKFNRDSFRFVSVSKMKYSWRKALTNRHPERANIDVSLFIRVLCAIAWKDTMQPRESEPHEQQTV